MHSMDPTFKFLFTVELAIFMVMINYPPFGLLFNIALLFSAFALARLPFRVVFGGGYLFALLVSFSLFLFHSFAHPELGHILLALGPLRLTDMGLWIGFTYVFRLANVALAAMLFVWTTKVKDFLDAAVSIRILPFQLAYAVFVTLRFMPLIADELGIIKDAHNLRGSPTGNPILHWMERQRRYLFTIFINSLRKGQVLSLALDSRGFGFYGKRSSMVEFKLSRSGFLFFGSFLALFVTLLILDPGAFQIWGGPR